MLALFDLDGTLIPWDSQLRFAHFVTSRFPAQRKFLPSFLRHALASAFSKAVHHKPAIDPKQAFLGYLSGMDARSVRLLAAEFARDILAPVVYPEVRQLLDSHLAQGDRVLLVSASPDFYVSAIGSILGVDQSYGTCVIEGKPDDWSFPVLPDLPALPLGNNKGSAKVDRLTSAGELAWAPPSSRIGYTDSCADLPMMAICDKGVVINPKTRLEQQARLHGWQILRPNLPVAACPASPLHLLRLLSGSPSVSPVRHIPKPPR